MTPVLGTAPDSWGVWFADDSAQTPWTRFLDEAAEVGYEWIELGPFGYLPTDPDTLARELEARALRVAAGGAGFPLEDVHALAEQRVELPRLCSLLRHLGARFLLVIDDGYTDLVTGEAIASPILDDAQWSQLVRSVEVVADVAARYGLQTVLHPHAETHVESESEIERFLDDTPDEIGLCLDVGHHAYGCGDPVAFYERHHSRIPYLHLKSVDEALRDKAREQDWPFARAVAEGVFVEPDRGAVDFLRLRDALSSGGYDGFAIVEQDMYPAPFERPLPVALRTRAYLEEIGFGTFRAAG